MGVASIPVSKSLALGEQVAQLKLAARQLAQNLLNSADQLALPGFPPTAELIDELTAYGRLAQQLADASGVSLDNDNFSLTTLGQWIETEGTRQSVALVSEQIEHLRHVDDPEFAPLERCRQEAMRLKQLVSQNPISPHAELDSIVAHRHPLISLLRLCGEGDGISDVEWAACHDDVASHYGRQLTTAVMRGRIHRVDAMIIGPIQPPPPTTVVEEIDQEPPLAPSKTVCAEPVAEPEPETHSETIFDDAPSTPSLSGQLRRSDIGSGILNPPVRPRSDLQLSADVHGTATDPPSCLRGTTTSNQIAQLISDNRMSLALHLTRCVELQPSRSQELPPSWILRALTLSRNLTDSRGDITRQFDDDLREFRPQHLTNGSDDLQIAMSFLTRAAALPAALLAGSGPAIAVLRSFKIEPGFSQLYNYCSRIAAAGDRFSEHVIEMFRPMGVASTAAELHELSLTTKRWLHEIASNATSYTKTSPLFLHAHWTMFAGTANRHADATALWCRWQDALSVIQRLLQPVCDQEESERTRVRQEISKLSASPRFEPDSDSIFAPAKPKSITQQDPTQTAVQSAVAIANRWLRLSQQATSAASQIPPEAMDLRDEVIKRTDAVVSELSLFRQTIRSPLALAAITCCQNTIHWIRDLFESRASLPATPLLRNVLNGELLRIPGIELTDRWLPNTAPDVVESELLAHVTNQPLSWRQAFDHHAHLGNHEATGRLLEMDVWSSEAERDSLESVRQAQIAMLRSTSSLELDEVAAEILASTSPELWSSPEVIAIQKRVDRLRQDLVRVTNFEATQRQIGHFRDAVRQIFTKASSAPPRRMTSPALLQSMKPELSAAGIPSQHIFTGE